MRANRRLKTLRTIVEGYVFPGFLVGQVTIVNSPTAFLHLALVQIARMNEFGRYRDSMSITTNEVAGQDQRAGIITRLELTSSTPRK